MSIFTLDPLWPYGPAISGEKKKKSIVLPMRMPGLGNRMKTQKKTKANKSTRLLRGTPLR
jgi:hypothetical protein